MQGLNIKNSYLKKSFWNWWQKGCTSWKKQKSSLQSVNQQLHPDTKGNLTLVREPGALQLAEAASSYNAGTILWAAVCEGASRASGFSLLQWRPAKDKRGVLLHGFLNLFGYCQPSVSRFSSDGGRHSAARVSQPLPPRRQALSSIGFIHWYFLPKASEVLTACLMKSCGRIGLTLVIKSCPQRCSTSGDSHAARPSNLLWPQAATRGRTRNLWIHYSPLDAPGNHSSEC